MSRSWGKGVMENAVLSSYVSRSLWLLGERVLGWRDRASPNKNCQGWILFHVWPWLVWVCVGCSAFSFLLGCRTSMLCWANFWTVVVFILYFVNSGHKQSISQFQSLQIFWYNCCRRSTPKELVLNFLYLWSLFFSLWFIAGL